MRTIDGSLLGLTQKTDERFDLMGDDRHSVAMAGVVAVGLPPLACQVLDFTGSTITGPGSQLSDLRDETRLIAGFNREESELAAPRPTLLDRHTGRERAERRPGALVLIFREGHQLAIAALARCHDTGSARTVGSVSDPDLRSLGEKDSGRARGGFANASRRRMDAGNDLLVDAQRRLGNRRQTRSCAAGTEIVRGGSQRIAAVRALACACLGDAAISAIIPERKRAGRLNIDITERMRVISAIAGARAPGRSLSRSLRVRHRLDRRRAWRRRDA